MRTWSERAADIAAVAARQLFFVGGTPRSGTTWVQHLLDAHPDVSCRGEGHFLQFLATPMGTMMQGRREALEAKNAGLLKETEGYPLPAADDFEFLVGSAVLLALAQQCSGRACLAVGEKTPENVFYFANLKRIFPGAKFIGVARDPRDALASAWHFIHEAGSGEDGARTAFIRRSVGAAGKFMQAMLDVRGRYPEDSLIVSYEGLQRSPDAVLAEVFRFLGVTDAADVVGGCLRAGSFEVMSGGRAAGVEQSGSFFRKGVVGDWVSTLTAEENEIVLRELGGMFPRFGWEA